jgi:aldehyde dehydrogenase (NAD+)
LKAAAESNLKKVTLELGGKSPSVVLPDANVTEAAKWAAFGIMYVAHPHATFLQFPTELFNMNYRVNMGQVCCAGSRVYVHESIYDSFMKEFMTIIKRLPVGDPFSPNTFNGPQVSKPHFDVSIPFLCF